MTLIVFNCVNEKITSSMSYMTIGKLLQHITLIREVHYKPFTELSDLTSFKATCSQIEHSASPRERVTCARPLVHLLVRTDTSLKISDLQRNY